MPRDRNLDRRLASLPKLSTPPERNPTVHALFKLECFEWYVIAGDSAPDGGWHFFGFVMPGTHFGFFTLKEIMSKTDPMGRHPELVVGFKRTPLLSLAKKILDPECPEG